MGHDDPFSGKTVNSDWAYFLDASGTYTPELTAPTDPTLGTGATQAGWWHRNGHLITGGAIFRFGTSGTNAGSGSYEISLPFDADVSALTANAFFGLGSVIGSCNMRDNSGAASSKAAIVYLATAGTARMQVADNGDVGSASPWAWTVSDAISISFAYLADPTDLPT